MKWLIRAIVVGASLVASASSAVLFPLESNIRIEIAGIGVVTDSQSSPSGRSDGLGALAIDSSGDYQLATTVAMSPPLLGTLTAARFSDTSQGGGSFDSPPRAFFPLVMGTYGGAMDLSDFEMELFQGGSSVGTIPLSVIGEGGSDNPVVLTGLFVATVFGNPWQLASTTVAGTIAGNPVTVTAQAFDLRSAAGAGVLQLVTPVRVRIHDGLGTDLAVLPGAGTLTLNYVPEPGSVTLMGLGLVALGIGERKRRRCR